MANSPSHRFGQIIGDVLEATLRPALQKIADNNNLYLDYPHRRPARNGKVKVNWKDEKGNKHDLDYVLEAGGSEKVVGNPRAFIEVAWRRYTKHSRNKAQEIQGAIGPLSETYRSHHPFLGALLGGEWTPDALEQLKSHGFSILYYPYDSIKTAFIGVGIDAFYDEQTLDMDFQTKIDAYEQLDEEQKDKIQQSIRGLHTEEMKGFVDALETVLKRTIESVYIVALHGSGYTLLSVQAAIDYLSDYTESILANGFVRYEVIVRYTNGNEIVGKFKDKRSAIDFLNPYL